MNSRLFIPFLPSEITSPGGVYSLSLDSAGGELFLRRWKSAKSVFQKSELASLKQRTFEKQRRFPPSKKRTPPVEAEPASILSLGCAFRPERRKQACRGTEAGAVAPCPGCVEFLIVYMD